MVFPELRNKIYDKVYAPIFNQQESNIYSDDNLENSQRYGSEKSDKKSE